MIRFILFLLNKTGFEPCKSCETLRAQLLIANEEKRLVTDTLLDIMKPKIVEVPTREIEQVTKGPMLWTRRRAILEEQERIKAERMKTSPVLAKSDKQLNEELKKTITIVGQAESISQLEQELGLNNIVDKVEGESK